MKLKLFLTSAFLFFAFAGSSFAADKYWVGGSGNWSDATNHWATTSGGAPGAGNLPTASDDVFFDSNSHTTDYTVTIDTGTKVMRDLNFAAPASGNVTWAGTVAMTVSGSMTLYSGLVRTYTGTITFNATTTGHTITQAGVNMLTVNQTFNGSGGEWTFQDAYTVQIWILTVGTIITNNQTVTTNSSIAISNGTLTLGTSAMNITGNVTINALVTFSGASATFDVSGPNTFNCPGHTFGDVTLTGGNPTITADTFANLTLIGAPSVAGLGSDITVTGTLTITGTNTDTSRYFLGSSVRGVQNTITAGAVAISDADFQDIVGAGTADWDLSAITGNSGDCGGNSGITFTTPQTQYWVGGTGNWNIPGEWASSSGGAGGSGRVPLPQDDVVFDANSFPTTGLIVSANKVRLGKSIDFTNATNSPTFVTNSVAKIFGSVTLIPNMTLGNNNQAWTLAGRGNNTFTSAGHTWIKTFVFDAGDGTYTLQDALTTSTTITHTTGTLDANGNNVTCSTFTSSVTSIRTLTMGSGNWVVTGTGTPWNTSVITGLTLDAGTSRIVSTTDASTTRTIATGNGTVNDVEIAGAGIGNVTLTGATTYRDIYVTSTANPLFILSTNGKSIRNLTFSPGYTGNWQGTSTITAMTGNITTVSGMTSTFSGAITYTHTSGTATITTGGVSLNADITQNGVGGTLELGDDYTGTNDFDIQAGTFNTNSHDMTIDRFQGSGTGVRAINLGSSLIEITQSGTGSNIPFLFTVTTNLTFNAGTSTIKFTNNTANTLQASIDGLTLYNFWFSRGNNTSDIQFVTGDVTFNQLKDDGTGAHTILFVAAKTYTMNDWQISGNPGALITITLGGGGTFNLVKTGGGVVSADYLNIQHSIARPWSGASGTDTWYAGANSVDNQAVASAGDGWIFTAAPVEATLHSELILRQGEVIIRSGEVIIK